MNLPSLDLLFPRACVGCGGRPWPLCVQCREGVAWLEPPGCRRCGRPLDISPPTCRDCPPHAVAWSRAPFHYEGPVRRALMRLKFSGQRSVVEPFAAWMVEALERAPPEFRLRSEEPGSMITWVPLGRRRRRFRGFDQAELLARAVGARTGLPVRRLLVRAVETAPQARRPGPERLATLRGAFNATALAPPGVVLVDDVLTSGATAAECANVLLAGGAEEVGVLTAARALGGSLPPRCYNPPGLQPGSVVARETSSR